MRLYRGNDLMSKVRGILKQIGSFLSRLRFERQLVRRIQRRTVTQEHLTDADSLVFSQTVQESIESRKPFISIVPLNTVPDDVLQRLERAISRTLDIETEITPPLDLAFAFDSSRNQYNSTVILTRLLEILPDGAFKILGVTNVDLFIPILTFVFGEAQLNGAAAVVSMYRMENELYGLPRDERNLQDRLTKELFHELGHTFGLLHCDDYDCVMHASTYAEEIDLKSDSFCASCYEWVSSILADK